MTGKNQDFRQVYNKLSQPNREDKSLVNKGKIKRESEKIQVSKPEFPEET